jgi:hypothetical protein
MIEAGHQKGANRDDQHKSRIPIAILVGAQFFAA